MQYPLISEYIEAIRLAADNFDKLSHLQPVLDGNGTPMMSSGNFAVVFKMYDPQAHKDVAVKCFLKEQEGRAESYQLIAQELAYTSSSFLTPFRYLDKEIFVESQSTNDEEFPVVLMDWVEGETLDRYIQSHLADPNALRLLAFQFSRLASWLLSQPFAHGDLKPDNILVRSDGTLTLVDYDGMFVPAMEGTAARELGSPDFRHPLRTAERFNEHIDDFPLAVILLSLKALSLSPSLWNTYGASDRLLFSATDYRALSSCALLQAFPPLLADPEFTRLYALFLLAHSEEGLSNVSFRLLNLKYPELVEEEVLSTKVTDEDLAEGVKDEFGVIYSKDGKRLLKGNKTLTEYTVRKGTRVICDRAFQGYYYNGFSIFHSSLTSLTSLTLPSSLQSIGNHAFCDCNSLTFLTLPSSLQLIGNGAFRGCNSLTSLTLPSSLQSIGGGAFTSCTSLRSVICNQFYKVIGQMLLSSDGTQVIAYWGKNSEVTIPEGVQSIGNSAFYDCNSLTSLTLPSSLQSIGDWAFGWCSSLTSLTLPSSLQSIGDSAFRGCGSLRSLTLPSSLQSIGDRAFAGCQYLASFTFPSSLQSIGDSAFGCCSSLTSLTFPSSLQSIGDSAFCDCDSLTSLTLPSSLQSIGGGAFTKCTSLRSVICNQFYKVIGQMLLSSDGTQVIAYWGKNSEVTIPEGVQSIGDCAFSSCKSLSSLTLPSSLQSIGDYAFMFCSSLSSLTLPSSLQSIGDSAFCDCSSLTSLYIPTDTEAHFKRILHAKYHKYLKPVN